MPRHMKRINNPCSHIPLIFYINAPSYPSGHPVLCTSVLFSCFFTSSYHCFILTQSFMIDLWLYTKKAAASSAAALISKITLFYDFFFLLIITPAATAKASAAIPSVPANELWSPVCTAPGFCGFTVGVGCSGFTGFWGFTYVLTNCGVLPSPYTASAIKLPFPLSVTVIVTLYTVSSYVTFFCHHFSQKLCIHIRPPGHRSASQT